MEERAPLPLQNFLYWKKRRKIYAGMRPVESNDVASIG